MNAPVLASAKAGPLSADVEVGAALVEQKSQTPPSAIVTDAERIRSSIVRLTSNSLEGLEGLASELQQLQSFLKSEVERVQNRDHCSLENQHGASNTLEQCPSDSGRLANPTGVIARDGQ